MTHSIAPWTTSDPLNDSRTATLWVVPVFANEAPSGDKLAADAYGTERNTAQANARLIAAAPDMVENLKHVIDILRWHAIPVIKNHVGTAPATPVEECLAYCEKILEKAQGDDYLPRSIDG